MISNRGKEARLDARIETIEKDIANLQTDELVLVTHHNDSRPYQVTQTSSEDIVLSAPCDIAKWIPYTSDDCLDIRFLRIGKDFLEARIWKAALPLQHLFKHGQRQGISYEIKGWAHKKNYYKEDARVKESELESKKSERAGLQSLQHDMIKSHPEAAAAADKLHADIKEREQNISELRCSTMTIEEAEQRLRCVFEKSKL